MQENMTCQLCKGTGQKLILVEHRYTKIKKMASQPCICLISRMVSDENKELNHLGEYYISPQKIDKQLKFDPENLKESPNLLIRGDNDSFLCHVKGIIMSNRFRNPKPRIILLRAIDIVHRFYVPQEDGLTFHLSALDVYDLVITKLGTNELNKALPSCLAQVVSVRVDTKKPVWMYLPCPTISSCREYSVELESLMENFKEITVSSVNGKSKKKRLTASKKNAANFGSK